MARLYLRYGLLLDLPIQPSPCMPRLYLRWLAGASRRSSWTHGAAVLDVDLLHAASSASS
jgi:hypothetical protein